MLNTHFLDLGAAQNANKLQGKSSTHVKSERNVEWAIDRCKKKEGTKKKNLMKERKIEVKTCEVCH